MGGMAVLEWPLCTPPNYVRHVIPLATSARHSAWCISWGEAQRQSIYSDPHYDDGYYASQQPPDSRQHAWPLCSPTVRGIPSRAASGGNTSSRTTHALSRLTQYRLTTTDIEIHVIDPRHLRTSFRHKVTYGIKGTSSLRVSMRTVIFTSRERWIRMICREAGRRSLEYFLPSHRARW